MLGNFYDVLMDGGDCLILSIVFLSSACLEWTDSQWRGNVKTHDGWIERVDWVGGWELGG